MLENKRPADKDKGRLMAESRLWKSTALYLGATEDLPPGLESGTNRLWGQKSKAIGK